MANKSFEEQCREIGRDFGYKLEQLIPTALVVGEVESVDEDAKTIDAVVDDDRVFRDVSLDIFPSGDNSVLFFPTVGSLVVIGFIENMAEVPVLLKVTKVDKIVIFNESIGNSSITIENDTFFIKRGDSTFEITNDKVSLTSNLTEFNGGGNGGTVLIRELTNSLNNMVTEISAAFTSLNAHTHTFSWAGTAGTSVTLAPNSSVTNPSSFSASDYENNDITQ